MLLCENELEILRVVVEEYKERRIGISDSLIAEELDKDPEDIKDILDMLELDRYVHLSKSGNHYSAFPEAKGRQMITNPEYIERKFGVAIALDALSEAIEKSENIPDANKKSLIDKLKDIKNDPYISNIGSGLVIEAFKRLMGQ